MTNLTLVDGDTVYFDRDFDITHLGDWDLRDLKDLHGIRGSEAYRLATSSLAAMGNRAGDRQLIAKDTLDGLIAVREMSELRPEAQWIVDRPKRKPTADEAAAAATDQSGD